MFRFILLLIFSLFVCATSAQAGLESCFSILGQTDVATSHVDDVADWSTPSSQYTSTQDIPDHTSIVQYNISTISAQFGASAQTLFGILVVLDFIVLILKMVVDNSAIPDVLKDMTIRFVYYLFGFIMLEHGADMLQTIFDGFEDLADTVGRGTATVDLTIITTALIAAALISLAVGSVIPFVEPAIFKKISSGLIMVALALFSIVSISVVTVMEFNILVAVAPLVFALEGARVTAGVAKSFVLHTVGLGFKIIGISLINDLAHAVITFQGVGISDSSEVFENLLVICLLIGLYKVVPDKLAGLAVHGGASFASTNMEIIGNSLRSRYAKASKFSERRLDKFQDRGMGWNGGGIFGVGKGRARRAAEALHAKNMKIPESQRTSYQNRSVRQIMKDASKDLKMAKAAGQMDGTYINQAKGGGRLAMVIGKNVEMHDDGSATMYGSGLSRPENLSQSVAGRTNRWNALKRKEADGGTLTTEEKKEMDKLFTKGVYEPKASAASTSSAAATTTAATTAATATAATSAATTATAPSAAATGTPAMRPTGPPAGIAPGGEGGVPTSELDSPRAQSGSTQEPAPVMASSASNAIPDSAVRAASVSTPGVVDGAPERAPVAAAVKSGPTVPPSTGSSSSGGGTVLPTAPEVASGMSSDQTTTKVAPANAEGAQKPSSLPTGPAVASGMTLSLIHI